MKKVGIGKGAVSIIGVMGGMMPKEKEEKKIIIPVKNAAKKKIRLKGHLMFITKRNTKTGGQIR